MATSILERQHVRLVGGGTRTVVLGHGLGNDQHIWRRVVPLLATTHEVVVFDHAGCGPAPTLPASPERYTGLAAYADDLVAMLEEMNRPPVHFVGHSASASIALLAAVKAPRLFASLGLLAASPRYLDDEEGYHGGLTSETLASVMALMDENFLGWAEQFSAMAAKDASLQQELDASFKQSERTMLRRFAEATLRSDIRSILPTVEPPCLVLASVDDDFVPRAVGTYLAAHLPRAQLTWLDVAGHCPQITHPTAVASALEAFWASLP